MKRIALSSIALLALFACTKELPGPMKAVPADMEIVGSIDLKAVISYAQETMPKVVPAEYKDKIPPIEALIQQALKLSSFDISKVSRVVFFSRMQDQENMGFLAEGLTAQALGAEKKGDHKGVALFELGELQLADLAGLGLAGARTPEMLMSIIETWKGDQKGLSANEQGRLLRDLLGDRSELDHLRVYALKGVPTGAAMTVKGGSAYMSLDKGVVVSVLSDQKGVDEMSGKFAMGLMAAQTALAMGGAENMGIQMDDAMKKSVTEMLGKVKSEKKGDRFEVSYFGDLRPLIEKAVALGVKSYIDQATAREPAEPPAAAPPAAAPPAAARPAAARPAAARPAAKPSR